MPFLLWVVIMNRSSEVMRSKTLKSNAKLVYWFLLENNHEGLTITQISKELGLAFPATSSAVAQLVAEQFVNRDEVQIGNGVRGLRPLFTLI